MANETFRLPENCKILVTGYRGSIAHGLYVPSSDPKSIDDIDIMGFVVAPVENYLGLTEWGSRGTCEYWDGQYDCVFYELRKAVSLLLQGNPNILSMLWLRPEDYLQVTPAWERLRSNRGLFVGQHVYNAFAGYAHAQMEKMTIREPAELREYMAITDELKRRGQHPNHKGEYIAVLRGDTGEERDVALWGTEKLLIKLRSYQKKGENLGYLGEKRKKLVLEHGYDTKNAAHLIRLLRMCKEFMQTGVLEVYRAWDRQQLLDIKMGKYSLRWVQEWADLLFEQCKEERDKSPLPEGPNRVAVEKLTVDILKGEL